MHNKRSLLVITLVVLALSAMLIPACAKPAPTVTKPAPTVTRTVKVAMIPDLTGPTAESCNPMVWAWQDYFDMINQQPGGFNGVKIQFEWVDCAYKLDLGLQAYEKFAEDKDILLISSPLTHVTEAASELATKAGIAFMAIAPSVKALWPVRPVYAVKPTYPDQLAAFVDWAIQTHESQKKAGPVKLAIAYLDIPYGKAIFEGGVQYAKARGVQIVADEPIPMATKDMTANLARVNNSAADYLYFQGNMPFGVMMCKDAVRTGFKIPIVNMGTNPGAGMIALGKDAVEGLLLVQWAKLPLALNEKEVTPGLEKVKKLIETYRPKEDPLAASSGYSVALPAAIMVGEAVKKAVDAVGVQGLNRETIRTQGLDRLQKVDVWDITSPLSYSATDHRGCDSIVMGEIRGGKVYSLDDWTKTPIVTGQELMWSKHLSPKKW